MHLLSIPCIAMAAVNFYVGAYYVFFYLKRPQIREHLPFALLCLTVGFYDVFSAGLYNSRSIDDGVFWQRLQLDTVFAISLFFIWFTGAFTRQINNRILRYASVGLLVVFAAALFAGPDYTLSPDHPAVKNITVLNFPMVTYYEGAPGFVYQVQITLTVMVYLYLVYLFIEYYRRTKYVTLLFLIVSQTLYFLGIMNDCMVTMQAYSFIYVSEYAFFFLILAMAYILLDRFVTTEADRERLETQLIYAQKMEPIGRLAVSVAHDFNNVLCAVKGFGSLLQQQVAGNAQGTEYTTSLMQAVSQGRTLIKSLLTFGRKEHNNPQPIDLNETIRNTEKILSMLIGKSAHLDMQFTDQNTVVYADANQITQVVMNLTLNALDAMPNGGALQIGTSRAVLDEARRKQHGSGSSGVYVTLSVTDSGTGMDQATRNRIFEPFFTTKEAGKGTGLGLSIVYGIVKQHNGFIDVQSGLGRGTAVKVFLPALEELTTNTPG